MRVLVTGGAGFIGSHYVRTMLSGGYPGYEDAEVTVFDKLTYAGNLANLAPVADSRRYRFVQGDICVPADLDAALPGHDVVVNFAAESHVDRSITGAAEFVLTNVLGAQQVFEAALRHGVGRWCTSPPTRCTARSTRARGPRTTSCEPNSPYSAAKAGSDLIARAYAKTYGLDIWITRCSQQLRALPLPREGDPAVRHQPAGRAEGAALRRGRQHPRLAVRRRPLPGHPAGAGEGCARRGTTTSAVAGSCPTGS